MRSSSNGTVDDENSNTIAVYDDIEATIKSLDIVLSFRDGQLPINLSGGLILLVYSRQYESEGHPVGATGTG